MARFRKFRRAASRMRSGMRRSRGGFRRMFGKGGVSPIQIDAMAYGAARAPVANALSGIFSKIPAGQYSDEVGMGIVNYLLARNTSGMVRDVAMKGLVVENARIGEGIVGGLGMGGAASTGYVYG